MLLTASRPLCLSILLAISLVDRVSGDLADRAEKVIKEPDPECTVTNPTTNEFFDLRPLIRSGPDKWDSFIVNTIWLQELTGILMARIIFITLHWIYASLCWATIRMWMGWMIEPMSVDFTLIRTAIRSQLGTAWSLYRG